MAFGDPFVKAIKVTVEDNERNASKSRLAEVDTDYEKVESEKAIANSDFNARLKDLRTERRKILNVINTGVEEREVECFERLNEELGQVETVRKDTGEMLAEFTRPWTAEERQRTVDEAIAENDAKRKQTELDLNAADKAKRDEAAAAAEVNPATGVSDEAPL